jgi:hypothetical protein
MNIARPMGNACSNSGAKEQRRTGPNEREHGYERHGHEGRSGTSQPRRSTAVRGLDEAKAFAYEAPAARVSKSSGGNGCRGGQDLYHGDSPLAEPYARRRARVSPSAVWRRCFVMPVLIPHSSLFPGR